MRGAREASLPFIGLHIAGKHRDQNNAAVTAAKPRLFPACSSQDLAARQVTTRPINAVSLHESSSCVQEFQHRHVFQQPKNLGGLKPQERVREPVDRAIRGHFRVKSASAKVCEQTF